jgi:hypothetical protein
MLKRLVVASGIFLIALAAFMLPILIGIYRGIARGEATGIAVVLGSFTENVVRIAMLMVLAIFAYWLSGKLIRH